MIEVTGKKTKKRYFLNESMIASFHNYDKGDGTIIYMVKDFNGVSDRYLVCETPDTVMTLIDLERYATQ